MYLKGVFTTVVGLATIVGTYMYAVDNKWIDDVPDLRVASKTVEIAPPPSPEAPRDAADTKTAITPVVLRPAVRPKPKRAKRARRRVVTNRTRRASTKRRTVSIFKVAKDIPHPNTQH